MSDSNDNDRHTHVNVFDGSAGDPYPVHHSFRRPKRSGDVIVPARYFNDLERALKYLDDHKHTTNAALVNAARNVAAHAKRAE